MKPAKACLLIAILSFSATLISQSVSRSPQRQSGFTLQQVMSAPFPTDLIASRTKSRFAWVFNSQGRRNVWVAEPGASGSAYAARQITKYSEDDGQDIGELAWTPDAQSIVYTRGGDLEFPEKPYPNPARVVQGEEQDVWIVTISGGEPQKLGEGHSPVVSPKGDAVAYVIKGQIWLVKLNSTEKPQQLIHSRGESGSLRWSPDGNSLAFVSDRGDHRFIGVYSIASKTLSYPDPSTDRDTEPVWSPDSRRIAFIRIPSSKDDLIFKPQREGPPWSIRVIDVATGTSREIWKASSGRGSVFRELTADNQLLWSADDRLLFPWEQDGWTHLYSVSTQGGSPVLLTPGSFEVEDVSLSPDLKSVLYSSNEGDIDRRHIWEVPVSGGTPHALSSGSGIETAPVMSADGAVVATFRSDAQFPLRPAIIDQQKRIRDLAPNAIPPDFPASRLVEPEQVIFAAADGMQIHGQLFAPPEAAANVRHPAVIFFHGGSRRQMLLGWHYMNYYSNAYAMNQYLASRGYVVLSVNYRSGIGYGLDFREALNYGADGASEFNDVQGAGLYLRSRNDVDPKRIGPWGGSYGGYLTALGLARSSDLFAAGVDLHGVHDWNEELKNWSPAYNPAVPTDASRLAWDSSPLASIATWRSPVLLIQGDDDRNVPFSQTVRLAEALRKQNIKFEELVFPDEIHDFLLFRNWLAAYTAASNFFDREFKGQQ
ncbi:MAG TPA: prolyl oligopeptidase family serine peptidase [Terriglobales bacterium]|nr:prolyl oligopeptidase family serine peptidase [Terriglobales bacterium]